MSVTLASHFNSQGFYTSNTLEQIPLKFTKTVHFVEDNLLWIPYYKIYSTVGVNKEFRLVNKCVSFLQEAWFLPICMLETNPTIISKRR